MSDVAVFAKDTFPLRAIFSANPVEELCAVQPMTAAVGSVYSFKYHAQVRLSDSLHAIRQRAPVRNWGWDCYKIPGRSWEISLDEYLSISQDDEGRNELLSACDRQGSYKLFYFEDYQEGCMIESGKPQRAVVAMADFPDQGWKPLAWDILERS